MQKHVFKNLTLDSPKNKQVKMSHYEDYPISSKRCLRVSTLNICWKGWCWSWSCNSLDTWCKEPAHWKRPWCWERLRGWGEGDNRKWDGWMASLTQWTWVWATSRRWWRTRKPCVLQSVGFQRVRHDLVTERQNNRLGSLRGFTNVDGEIKWISTLAPSNFKNFWGSQTIYEREGKLQVS